MAGHKVSLQQLQDRFHVSQGMLEKEVSDEHQREVSRILDDHEIVGPELGLTGPEMTAINRDLKTQEHQRAAILNKWKQKFSFNATYCMLIKALLRCDKADHARQVCELLAQSASPEQPSIHAAHYAALPTSLPNGATTRMDGAQHGDLLSATSHSTPPLSPPTPGQSVNVPGGQDISQLREKVKHLEMMFEDLLQVTSNYLEKKIPIPKIRKSLYAHRASDTETDTDLVAGLRHEIREADTVDDLFDILSTGKCWDFLNPGLLKRIIDDHCSESMSIQRQKEEYLEKLQHFRKTTLARQFAKVCKVSTPNPKFTEVVFEMGKDWDNATLEDVENLKQEIRGQGYLSDHMLNFKRSKNSSISLVWALPRSCPVSTTILRIPPSFYLEHGIRRVLVKGVCMVDVKFEEVVAKQPDIRVQLQEGLKQKEGEVTSPKEEVASIKKVCTVKLKEAEENLKTTMASNEELRAALEKAKMQQKVQEEGSYLGCTGKNYELLEDATGRHQNQHFPKIVAAPSPDLSYVLRCESCGHSWSVLSQGDTDLACHNCGGRKVRAPNKRGAYKYKCDRCGHKWKKKNSSGGSTLCPKCSNPSPIFPYKFRLDPRRMFGQFFCKKCDHGWASGNAWEGRGQQCKQCLTNIPPHSLHPLRQPQHLAEQKPHREDLCGRCKELGYNCRNQPFYDEESVISTSDSSVVFGGPPDDATTVPSEGGSDICSDSDELSE